MTSNTVQGWEAKARRIGKMMKNATDGAWQPQKDNCQNVKLFYNPRWMFEPQREGVKRVFIGIHPAGAPYNPKADNPCGDMLEYLDEPKSDRPHNQWIDGCWAGNGKTHQHRVHRVFAALSVTGKWRCDLRATPSFNVSPIRTKGTDGIRESVWEASVELCADMVRQLRPKTIICDGFGETGMSPWAVIKSEFSIESSESEPRCGRTVVKWGTVPGLADDGTTIIGLPQLTSQWFRNSLFDHLAELRTKLEIA